MPGFTMNTSKRLWQAWIFLLCLTLPVSRVIAEVCASDDWQHVICLEHPARRIVSLYGAFAEMLYAIGAGPQLIARTRADKDPPEIRKLPSVGTHMRPNVELILGLKPDLVIQSASRRAATPEMQRLVEAGIPVAVFGPKDFQGVFHTMERLGVLTGHPQKAREVVANLRRRLQAVVSLTRTAQKRPRAVFEIRSAPLTVAGTGSMAHQIMEAAGAVNAVTQPKALVRYSLESLLQADPDVYIVQQGPMNRHPVPPAERPHFARLRAVRSGKVIMVDEHLYSRPGPRCVEAVEHLARKLHPELFDRRGFFQGTAWAETGPPEPRGSKRAGHLSADSSEVRPEGKKSFFLDWKLLKQRLLKPLIRLTVFVAIGLFVGNLIEALHWTHALGRLTRPLLRWGHLGDHSAVAFMAAFFSGVTANTMLMNAHKDGRLSTRELTFSCLVNTLPSYFLHLPTTFFILLPLVKQAGVLYLTVTFCAALFRTAVTLAAGRVLFPPPPPSSYTESTDLASGRDVLKKTWRKFKRRLARVLYWTVPIYTLFFFLTQAGLFTWLQNQLARWAPLHFLPVEAVTVVAFQVMAEFTAGAAAAGALLDAGTLSVKGTVLALLAGNVISTPIRALRHQLPYYMGIYTPRLGLTLLTVGQTARVGSVILFGILFYTLYPG